MSFSEVAHIRAGVIEGGRCHFLPQEYPQSCRLDDKDLLAEAVSEGFSYIPDRMTFDSISQTTSENLPIIGLFSPGVYVPQKSSDL